MGAYYLTRVTLPPDSRANPATRVVVIKELSAGSYELVEVGADFSFISNSWFQTVAEAIEQAEADYDVTEWIELRPSVTDAEVKATLEKLLTD